jgi:uncharacterized protein
MSNINTIKTLIGALEAGNADAFRALLADDVRWEYHPTGNTAQDNDVPYMRLREGAQSAATGFLSDIAEDFDLNDLYVKAFMEGDGHVAVLLGYELTVTATGKRVRDEEIHLYEFDADGKVTAFRHFLDTAKAIEAHS